MEIVLDGRARPAIATIDVDQRRFDAGGADIDTDRLVFHAISWRSTPRDFSHEGRRPGLGRPVSR